MISFRVFTTQNGRLVTMAIVGMLGAQLRCFAVVAILTMLTAQLLAIADMLRAHLWRLAAVAILAVLTAQLWSHGSGALQI